MKLHDAFETPTYFYFCLELLSERSLWDVVLKEDALSEEKVKKIALELGQGIQSLHKRGICLRDLDAKSIHI